MKSLYTLFLFCFFTVFSISQSQFNVDKYKQYLQANQNLTSEQLLENYTAGTFKSDINQHGEDALFFDSINIKYALTDYEKSLINKHGFMVSERLSYYSFGQALIDIYHKDLPVFISTDAILHAFHKSYDDILKDVELYLLIENLEEMLMQMHSNFSQLNDKYSSNSGMNKMLQDVDVYLTVPLKLLGEETAPFYSENSSRIDTILNLIYAEQGFVRYNLFSTNEVIYDWSQFKPRGHYTDENYPKLADYFRAMMWLGRIEIYLIAPEGNEFPPSFEDVQRQAIDAMLIEELFQISNVNDLYKEMEDILTFFVNEPDNVTIENLGFIKEAVSLNNPSDLLDSLKFIEFQDTIKNQSFAYQKILSQIILNDPFKPDSIVPASAFMLFGQRFIVDSYITGSVVYDRIRFNGEKICRLFPSALDPIFALGNDASLQLLQSELDKFKYSSNLAALRYLVNSYDTEFWNASIYNMWLNSIRNLNPQVSRENLPEFMKTAAFWQEKLNTQLTSWTQLRHDNLLYAKPSYSGGIYICSFPYSYVEPFPEFYNELKNLADIAIEKFKNFEHAVLNNYAKKYFEHFSSVCDTLESISKKELNSEEFTPEEKLFLTRMLSETPGSGGGCGAPMIIFNGWYPDLFYSEYQNDKFLNHDNLVADIHTTPTDCDGHTIGAVTHVGTGKINLGVFIAEHEGTKKAFIGPLFSYYEYVTTNFLRLTDEEWTDEYLASALRPSWVNLYLADITGNSRGTGLQLLTSVDGDENRKEIPLTHLVAANYPNPFNPSTIISFTIPYDLSNSNVELVIYNIQGEVVARLINDILPAGNYLTRWNGTNDHDVSVTSGVYIYSLKAGDMHFSGKMTLLK